MHEQHSATANVDQCWEPGIISVGLRPMNTAATVIEGCTRLFDDPPTPRFHRVHDSACRAAQTFPFDPLSPSRAALGAAAQAVLGLHYKVDVKEAQFKKLEIGGVDTWFVANSIQFSPPSAEAMLANYLERVAIVLLAPFAVDGEALRPLLTAILIAVEIAHEIAGTGQRHDDVLRRLLSQTVAASETYAPEIGKMQQALLMVGRTTLDDFYEDHILYRVGEKNMSSKPSPRGASLVYSLMGKLGEFI